MTDLNTCRTKFKLDRSLSVPFSQIRLFSEILSWQTNKIVIHIRRRLWGHYDVVGERGIMYSQK